MEESVQSPESIAIRGPAWRAAEESGVDMSLVEDSLRRPVWERIQQHRAALDTLLMLREAYIRQYGGA